MADPHLFDHTASVLATSEERLYDQINSSFTWLLATLFTANGGALVALVSKDNSQLGDLRVALVFFAVGVVASISMGIWNAVYASKAILPTTDLRMTLVMLEAGHVEFEEFKEKMGALKEHRGIKFLLYASAAVSLLCLIGGMIAFGYAR
jgi:hypothetical protein